jgi:OmcA/MtrC family decaheme c-type cytochrome
MTGFAGSPSVYFAWAVPQDGITAPVDFNATASGYIENINNGTATGTGAGTLTGPDASGYYTIVLTGVTVPSSATMLTGGVGYTYGLSTTQPLTQISGFTVPSYLTTACTYSTGNKVGGLSVPAPNLWKVATGYTARRTIVDTAKCNACHVALGAVPTFHAGQRNDAPTCSFCHTTNRVNSGWSVNAKDSIHAIHAAGKRVNAFTWEAAAGSRFQDVTYPGVLNDCLQCHVAGMFDFSNSTYTSALIDRMLFSTAATGSYSATNTPYPSPFVSYGVDYGTGFSFNAGTGVTTAASGSTLVISPISAACSACHDTDTARAHMKANGGAIYQQRSIAIP